MIQEEIEIDGAVWTSPDRLVPGALAEVRERIRQIMKEDASVRPGLVIWFSQAYPDPRYPARIDFKWSSTVKEKKLG